MQIKGIVFDYGGVLCFFPPEQQVAELAELCRVDLDTFQHAYWSIRHAYDRAEFTPQGYWRAFGQIAHREYTDDEIEVLRSLDIQLWLRRDQRMMDWADRVRAAGIRTAVLSNLPRDLGEYLRNSTDLLTHFDHHSFSYELDSAKPDGEIYLHAVDGLGLEPREALFIDDRTENVTGAEAVGLHGILFESPEGLRASLARSGLQLPPI